MVTYLIGDNRGRNLDILTLFRDNLILTKLRRYCCNLSAVTWFFLKMTMLLFLCNKLFSYLRKVINTFVL